MTRQKRPAIGTLIYFLGALALGFYFTFAAIQGDYGVLKRSGIAAEGRALEVELQQLRAEVARMENLTMRLSDKYLDLDLLDEQARDVLGLIRTDEMVIR
ncbi:septum formation initiator precursor [Loktanella sp. 3ANDIMAR09]|uniref:FtsB family cell division protein n=1 Tax=Loktanella sp. 3ANDIMAR09 TaxID=1225657 RepID=UPI0006FC6539|nr:septum formation initiator family protein [Loktanella sp. 3ANDIMAR09]KQI69816.1 septum formation initiator precursor [Loktanella sp. 3ANDIMAR09]